MLKKLLGNKPKETQLNETQISAEYVFREHSKEANKAPYFDSIIGNNAQLDISRLHTTTLRIENVQYVRIRDLKNILNVVQDLAHNNGCTRVFAADHFSEEVISVFLKCGYQNIESNKTHPAYLELNLDAYANEYEFQTDDNGKAIMKKEGWGLATDAT